MTRLATMTSVCPDWTLDQVVAGMQRHGYTGLEPRVEWGHACGLELVRFAWCDLHGVTRGKTRATSFEKMRRDDDLYKLGIVVEYNTHPVNKGYGSAIFFHLWRGKGRATEGCIALSEDDLSKIVRWLDPAAAPVVMMGTNITLEDIKQ